MPRRSTHHTERTANSKGQSLVEFAIMLPVLLLIFGTEAICERAGAVISIPSQPREVARRSQAFLRQVVDAARHEGDVRRVDADGQQLTRRHLVDDARHQRDRFCVYIQLS